MKDPTGKVSGVIHVTPVTPTCIGDGEKLSAPLDYEISNGQVIVKDIQRFILKGNPGQPLRPKERAQILSHGRGREIRRCLYNLSDHYGERIKTIRTFQKNAKLNVCIPGSSIKGVLRTAIAVWRHTNSSKAVRDFLSAKADSYEENESQPFLPFDIQLLRGETYSAEETPSRNSKNTYHSHSEAADIHTDWLRRLIIRDSNTRPAKEVLGLYGDLVYSKGSAHPIAASEKCGLEAIVPSLKHKFSIPFHFDGFHPKNYHGNLFHSWLNKFMEDAALLGKVLLEHSKGIISFEKQFYRDTPSLLSARQMFSKLEKRINQGEIILPLGYGTGWHTKTIGLLLPQHYLRRLKNTLRGFAKYGIEGFPKSRKLAAEGKERLPMGWVKIDIVWDN